MHGQKNIKHRRGISPKDMPRHLSRSSERNLGSRTPCPSRAANSPTTLDEIPDKSPGRQYCHKKGKH